MTQIGYIAPNARLAEIARKVSAENNLDIVIEVGHTADGARKAESLIRKGIKVLISRGGTSQDIRNKLNVQVVEIPISIKDVSDAILEAKKYGPRIAIIGFFNLLNGLESLNPILNVSLKQVFVNNENEAMAAILQMKAEGIDAVIGGEIQCKLAAQCNVNAVFLESGPLAFFYAYKEAESILGSLLKEQQRTEELRAVFDYARDGFIAVNKKGEVTLINAAAAKMMQCDVDNSVGRPIKKICPDLSNLMEVLTTGKEYLHDIVAIGSTNILCNRVPVSIDNEIVGAVATLQDVATVQEAESKIRRKIYTSGLYARYQLQDIDGTSELISNAKDVAEKFSKTDSTVLITGETGTGKELFAQSIHNASRRYKGPFVAVNCASLPESILESEVFGYVEGAFTGTRKGGKAGLFELAHDGTIFLDEISEMPLALQGRLLRVLQEKMVMRLGDDKVIPVNVRVIAATNRDLIQLINEGKFREDLYFRLNILRLHLPPLRERKQDIPILAKVFLKEIQKNRELKFSPDTLNVMMNYSWPGNVRELRNLVERLTVITTADTIRCDQVDIFFKENQNLFKAEAKKEIPSIEEIEKALQSAGNNKAKAAKLLGIHRCTLWRLLKKSR